MYALPQSNYLRRSLLVNNVRHSLITKADPLNHSLRIRHELELLGASKYGLRKLESRYLPHIIHPYEKLMGVVYGRHKDGSAMLLATDRRVIFLDKKPLFVNEDEITYDVVSGISYGHAGLGSTVTLHTRIKDYTIRTFNQKCALGFIHQIESRCLEHNLMEERYDNVKKDWSL